MITSIVTFLSLVMELWKTFQKTPTEKWEDHAKTILEASKKFQDTGDTTDLGNIP